MADEGGSVIVIALVMLMLLTMVGTSAIDTATLEIQVAGNERKYKQNFFKTEAAALQGSQRVQNDAATIFDSWIRPITFRYDPVTPNALFDNINNWTDLSSNGSAYANTFAMIVYAGEAWGEDARVTGPKNQLFSVYGQYLNTARNEKYIIETAFSKRM